MYVLVVLTISVIELLKVGLVLDCHLTIEPVYPLKIKVILSLVEHTPPLPVIVPPTEVESIIMVSTVEYAIGQTPFLITAR